jgi:hypothetical protein
MPFDPYKPDPRPDAATDTLIAARDLIVRWGWVKGRERRWWGWGGYCAVGALRAAAPGNFVPIDAYQRFGLAAGVPYMEIPQWNDQRERTLADVMRVFERAILA